MPGVTSGAANLNGTQTARPSKSRPAVTVRQDSTSLEPWATLDLPKSPQARPYKTISDYKLGAGWCRLFLHEIGCLPDLPSSKGRLLDAFHVPSLVSFFHNVALKASKNGKSCQIKASETTSRRLVWFPEIAGSPTEGLVVLVSLVESRTELSALGSTKISASENPNVI